MYYAEHNLFNQPVVCIRHYVAEEFKFSVNHSLHDVGARDGNGSPGHRVTRSTISAGSGRVWSGLGFLRLDPVY